MENTVRELIATYSQQMMAVWIALWGITFGWVHAVAFLLWNIPFLISVPDNLYIYTVVIKALILLAVIIGMKPWNILKTAIMAVVLFIILLVVMTFTPINIPLKGMLMYMTPMTIAHVILLYLLLVILSALAIARDEVNPTFLAYVVLSIDYLITLSTRNYTPLAASSVVIPILAVIQIIQRQKKVMRRG